MMYKTLSETEAKELRERICRGLDLAYKNMLKEKSIRNQKVIISSEGKIKVLSARYLYRKLYGKKKKSVF